MPDRTSLVLQVLHRPSGTNAAGLPQTRSTTRLEGNLVARFPRRLSPPRLPRSWNFITAYPFAARLNHLPEATVDVMGQPGPRHAGV